MGFDRELCRRIARGGDRNFARYFAGREDALDRFDAALEDAAEQPQTVFRLFQGAPGSGKTSLLRHLAETRADDRRLLFVPCGKPDLESHHALELCVARAVHAAAPGKPAPGFAGEPSPSYGPAKDVDATIVLVHDEAQRMDDAQREVLSELHAGGLRGMKSVLLLAGLSHTASVLSEGGKISRPDRHALCEMGVLRREESVESTTRMLADVDPASTEAQRGALVEQVAAFSDDYPQHLNCAQAAMCDELLRVDGEASLVDVTRIERDTAQARAAYYMARLQDPVLGHRRDFTHKLIARIAEEQPRDTGALEALCRAAIEREKPLEWSVPPRELAQALISKGVACETRKGYVIPIPSMVRWSEQELRRNREGRVGR